MSAAALAQQMDLPFPKHGDEILKEAYPGDPNTRLISPAEIPQPARDALANVDLAFEMGDGYYDVIASALYEVNDGQKVVGYLEAALLSYTQDPDISLAGAMINVQGVRLSPEPAYLNSFSDIEDPEILNLPVELHPQPEE